jgi:hypothetical protein
MTAEKALPLARIVRATLIAAAGGISGNTLLWLMVSPLGRLQVGLGEVIVFSLLGGLAGGVLYGILSRLLSRPNRLFVAICVVVLILYAFGPIWAAQTPYREGAEPFNLLTVLVTEVMHLISGGFVIGVFTRLTTASHGS